MPSNVVQFVTMNETNIFETDYWPAALPETPTEAYHGKITADTRREAKTIFRYAIGQLLTSGTTKPVEQGTVLDWDSFSQGTVLLLDQESQTLGRPPKDLQQENIEEINRRAKQSALQVLFEESNRCSDDFSKEFGPYFGRATNSNGMRYSRYVNLTVVAPNSKGHNTAIDLLVWDRSDKTRVATSPLRSGFMNPS